MNAVVGGLPRSWQTAPSITATCCGRSRSSIRVRASSMTSSVCTQTSPSGCHSGSCGQPTSASSSGNSRSTTPSSSASAKPIDGRAAWSSSFSISPQIRSAGRSSSGSAGTARACRRRVDNSKRAANWTARSTRRLSSPNVRGIDRAQQARARGRARPSNGSRYSSVSGSQAIALIVKSRRRAASSNGRSGSPVTVKPAWPRPVFDSRRGSDTSMPATL